MRNRNDPRQYDELVTEWWKPDGVFAMLHWLAKSRGALVPPATGDSVLVDLGCGGGLTAPHVTGYRHIGVDLRQPNLSVAAHHGVVGIRGDAQRVPLADECADVVLAGEILEHVEDWRACVAEACRLLRPGGTLIVDTIADTALARLVAVRLAERVPGGPPPGIHDPALFVPPKGLVAECARHGVALRTWGVRPAIIPALRWLRTRRDGVPMVSTRSHSILYAGRGVKHAPSTSAR
ncbi:methyltransferase domain-containing protein [Stackebrandtia soli]|uniref:methyltransferase domain-containing protein n=1 Tax=Stackebrandtia soli TaxID=1892856 RepID=UPI0039E85F02